jgi:hypothetical protein
MGRHTSRLPPGFVGVHRVPWAQVSLLSVQSSPAFNPLFLDVLAWTATVLWAEPKAVNESAAATSTPARARTMLFARSLVMARFSL